MKQLKYIFYLLAIVVFLIACKTVAITGRKQLNLVPNTLITTISFASYETVVKTSPTLPPSHTDVQMVNRVGQRIQQAVETYMLQNLFPDSGGVPVPNEQTDGSMINHPDTDLANPEWNRSGVPWHTLYYKENYPRLREVKPKWDPLNIFYHALSIRV